MKGQVLGFEAHPTRGGLGRVPDAAAEDRRGRSVQRARLGDPRHRLVRVDFDHYQEARKEELADLLD